MTVVLLLIATVSCVLSQNYDITISRFSTSATAMFLIWFGMIINKKWRWNMDKRWGFAIALIVFLHCVVMSEGRMVLAHNKYQNLPFLIAGSTAAIYLWGYIGRKIEKSFVGRFLALLGRESLYLMAFHIVGFFICNSLMIYLNVFSMDSPKGLYTFTLGNNGWLLCIYVLFGVLTPILIINLYRYIKTSVVNVYLSIKFKRIKQ
jgi:hypothetical protein